MQESVVNGCLRKSFIHGMNSATRYNNISTNFVLHGILEYNP